MIVSSRHKLAFAAICVGWLVVSTNSANAGFMQTFQISSPTAGGGHPVDAKATFDIDDAADQITITLENLTIDPTSVNQNLSGLFFSVTTGQTSGTLDSSSGTELFVNGDGTYSTGSTVSTGWALLDGVVDPNSGTTGLQLDLLSTSMAPAMTIVGAPGANNLYNNANNSITGAPHNPLLNQVATYVVSISGLTADSRIGENVTFQFNTAADTFVNATVDTPEPASSVLLGMGILGCLGCCRLRRKTSAAA